MMLVLEKKNFKSLIKLDIKILKFKFKIKS